MPLLRLSKKSTNLKAYIKGVVMIKCVTVCLTVVLSCGWITGCGVSEKHVPDKGPKLGPDAKKTEVRAMAEIKTMMTPMRKDPVSGIRDAVAEGMPVDGPGYETKYVDMQSNGTTIKLAALHRMLIILPANQTTPYHWSDLEVDESVVSLTINEYVSDPNPEGMMGVGGHKVFEIKGIAPGKAILKTEQTHVGNKEDVDSTFELLLIVEEK